MAVQDKFADEMLTDEQLDKVSGGWFFSNDLPIVEYEEAGIKVIEHYFKLDEFWYNGVYIGHYKATAVGVYFKKKKTSPGSVDDAVHWYENDYPNALRRRVGGFFFVVGKFFSKHVTNRSNQRIRNRKLKTN